MSSNELLRDTIVRNFEVVCVKLSNFAGVGDVGRFDRGTHKPSSGELSADRLRLDL